MGAKKCIECKTPIRGRSDKKYCGDSCRSAHNNRQRGAHRRRLYQVDRALHRNYQILLELLERPKSVVVRKELNSRGFDFGLMTSWYTTKNGQTYHYIYDLGYLELQRDQFLIVQKHENHLRPSG